MSIVLTEDNRPADVGIALPTITLDVDGVAANFIQKILDMHFERTMQCYSWEDLTAWNPVDLDWMTARQFQELWSEAMTTRYFWAHLEPYRDFDFERLNEYLLTGQFVAYFVTHRANLQTPDYVGDARFLTRAWLDRMGVTADCGVIAGHHNRTDLLQMLGSQAHLEDYGVEFERLRAAGLNAWLIDRPWNRYVDTPYRVYCLQEFLDRTV